MNHFEEKKENRNTVMKILVIGGTRFFGIPMVRELLLKGHQVTIATRGKTQDIFGDSVKRITLERTEPESMRNALADKVYDVVIDKIAYCSIDIKSALDVIDCQKYIYMSTTAVYHPKHINTKEEEFDGVSEELIWCNRSEFSYDKVKRQAECALCQVYGDRNWIAVRYPFVIGKNDYTNRLRFYVEHVINSAPMYIDNLNCQMGFIRSDEAGRFLAFLADRENVTDNISAINGSSMGTISLKEILDYVEKRTGKKAILDPAGEAAPYNGETEYSINTERAQKMGFQFSNLHDWIYDLLDYYIDM